MNDDELTRLAIKLLEKEGQRFVRERALTKPGPLKANKAFLRAQLKHNEISNRRINCKSDIVDHPVSESTVKSSQNESSRCHIMPTKRHTFNRNCLKNKTHINKLTKDLKVSFKFQMKGTSLQSKMESANVPKEAHDDMLKTGESKSDVDVVESHEDVHNNAAMNVAEDVVNISDTDSIISISSSEVPPSKIKRKKLKKTRDESRKKHKYK